VVRNGENRLNEIAACPFCDIPITKEKNTVQVTLNLFLILFVCCWATK